MPTIELREVTKRFGVTMAVERLSFSAGPGEALCLFGPSGCGKTTVLRLIAGLERPDAGHVLVDGLPVNSPRPGGIGMVFQDLALWPHMRVERHLDFVLSGGSLSRAARRERIENTLAACQLADRYRAFPAEMSGGEQQRLAIARALAPNPPLLLLDEPLANLDAALKDRFLAEFARRRDEGATLVFATHDRAEAERLATRTLLMKDRCYNWASDAP